MSKSATPLHKANLGPGSFNFPRTDTRRPSMDALVSRFGFWVHRAVSLNAQAAASVPFRLFTTEGAFKGERNATLHGREVKNLDHKTKAFLKGNLDLKPGRKAMHMMRGRVDDMSEVESHPVLDLLDDVNDWTEGFAYREALYSALQIFGNNFTDVVTGTDGLPTELWYMLPQKMKVIPDAVTFVSHYEYGTGPDLTRFSIDDVIWVKLFDPHDPWGGLGPVEAWLKTIDAGFAIQAFQDWLFKRGGAPDYIVKSDVEMPRAQRDSFVAEWGRLFGRLFNRKRAIGFLSGAGTELQKIGQTNRELEFIESARDNRDMIGQAFGVPKSKLTTDDVNRANSRETDEIHIRETIWPMVHRQEDVWNERLLPRYGENLLLIHENPVPEDRVILVQERTSKLQSGYSINEQRLAEGEEPHDDPEADKPLVAAGLVRLEDMGIQADPFGFGGGGGANNPMLAVEGEGDSESTEPQAEAASFELFDRASAILMRLQDNDLTSRGAKALLGMLGIDAATGDELIAAGVVKAHDIKLLPPNEISHADMWAEHYAGTPNGHSLGCCEWPIINHPRVGKQDDPSGRGFPVQFAAAIRRAFGRQLQLMADSIEDLGPQGVLDLIGQDQFLARFVNDLRPEMDKAIARGAAFGLRKLPVGVQIVFDVQNPQVTEFIEQHVVRLAHTINGSTQHLMANLLTSQAAQNASIPDMANAIRGLDARVSGRRADMIARTEMARAHVTGEQETWKISGVVDGKRWLLAPNACEFCRALDREFRGKTIPLDQPFYPVGHTMLGLDGGHLKLNYTSIFGPPLHPHDRCDLLPVLTK